MYTLIFCAASDIVAYSLYDALFQKKQRKLRIITDAELAFASWLHEAGSDGVFFTRIRLSDGFIVDPSMIKNAVNRIDYFPMPHFINETDRLYAEMEMMALYMSFLYSIKEKVIDGMPVKHINTAHNTLYFYSLAAKAGLDVLDNQFTSSPRWMHPKTMTAMCPQKKQTVLWHKKTPSLVWENKPVLYNETFTGLLKVEVIANNLFYDNTQGSQSLRGTRQAKTKLPAQFQKKIKTFSDLTGKTVYEITLAAINAKYKVYAVNMKPVFLSTAAIEAFAEFLIKNNKKR